VLEDIEELARLDMREEAVRQQHTIAAVEAAIALSVLFLAAEIARNDHVSLTFRFPVIASASFGLLHGFGFAAGFQR